jgi:hypothetical protein
MPDLSVVLSAIAVLIAVAVAVRQARRDRATVSVRGECDSVPGCYNLLIHITKIGMTPIQLNTVGLVWGHIPRRPWQRQTESVFVVNAYREQERPHLEFHGQVFTENTPMQMFVDHYRDLGDPTNIYVETANGRIFLARVPKEVVWGLREASLRPDEP